MDAYLVQPRDLGDAQATDSVPNADGLDFDQLAILLVHTGIPQLLEPLSVHGSCVWSFGFVGKRLPWELVVVIVVVPVLHVLEDGVEVLQTLSGEKA